MSIDPIYADIYALARGEQRLQLLACLHKQGRGIRLPRTRGADRRSQIPEMVSIDVRPPEVEDRAMPGDWERDFIKGAGNMSSMGVLLEQTSRLVLLAQMQVSTAAPTLASYCAKLNSTIAPMPRSFTCAQRMEMSWHKGLSAATGARVYFCDAHSLCQRGTCENNNGLLRQYLPTSTDLSVFSPDDFDAIADSLNNRARTTQDFDTPLTVLSHSFGMAQQRSISIH